MFIKKLFHYQIESFRSIVDLARNRHFLTLAIAFTIAVLTFMITGFDRHPYNYLYNAIFLAFAAMVFVYLFLRKRVRLDQVVVFIVLMTILIAVSEWLSHSWSLSPFVNMFGLLVFYEIYSEAIPAHRKLFVRAFYYGTFVCAMVVCFYYLPAVLRGSSGQRLGSFFGNQDAVGYIGAICFCLALHFLKRRDWMSILALGFSGINMAVTQTRTSWIFAGLGLAYFLFSLARKSRKWTIVCIVAAVAVVVGFFTIPAFSGIRNRIFSAIGSLFGGTDDSTGERVYITLRSYLLAFINPAYGYGYPGSLRYSPQAAHDMFGDASLYFGGIAALVSTSFLVYVIVRFIRTHTKNRDLLVYFALCLIVYFFLGNIWTTRFNCFFLGMGLGILSDGRGIHLFVPCDTKPQLPTERYFL